MNPLSSVTSCRWSSLTLFMPYPVWLESERMPGHACVIPSRVRRPIPVILAAGAGKRAAHAIDMALTERRES
jgi:hypothetical protein